MPGEKFVPPSKREEGLYDLSMAEDGRPSGKTRKQPFITRETAGSRNFRIPAMVTLDDGRIVAAADARWEQAGDACGISIVVSYSDDHGETWTYHTPIHFNDSVNGGDFSYMSKAAVIMDSALTKDQNGNLYLLADIYPSGIALNTVPEEYRPSNASGFVTMEDGKKRPVFYLDSLAAKQTIENWVFYAGDFEGEEENAMAPVYRKGEKERIPYFYIDRGYYLYDKEKKPLYTRQLGAPDKKVKQNVFYTNADLHMRCATYLALFKSTDRGESWSKPMILNPQILEDVTLQPFLGSAPGRGIALRDGTLVIPVYEHPKERASLLYSKDGKNWKRSANAPGESWSSESAIIEVNENKIRQFVRHGDHILKYLDYEKKGEEWIPQEYGYHKDIKLDSTCQLSAIKLEKIRNGKSVVVLSVPSGYRRKDGKLFTFLLDENGGMEKIAEYAVTTSDETENKFAYSCLTELKNGKIGLLVEDGILQEEITYRTFTLEEITGGKIQTVV